VWTVDLPYFPRDVRPKLSSPEPFLDMSYFEPPLPIFDVQPFTSFWELRNPIYCAFYSSRLFPPPPVPNVNFPEHPKPSSQSPPQPTGIAMLFLLLVAAVGAMARALPGPTITVTLSHHNCISHTMTTTPSQRHSPSLSPPATRASS
jgi:hypothetical protein